MSARARRSHDDFAHDEFWPGERISPVRRGRAGRALRRGIAVLVVFGGGWALLSDPGWREWTFAKVTDLSSFVGTQAAALLESRPPVTTASAPPRAEPAPRLIALDEPPATAPPTVVATAPAVSTPYEAPAAAPPDAEPASAAHQKRAEAVGLHPGLSRAVLERLSDADYRNAEIAVRRAVAETPDTGVFVWPRQRESDLALFKVRFVQGAAADCRRYVVTITKDRWLTTALPMERCGPQTRQARRE